MFDDERLLTRLETIFNLPEEQTETLSDLCFLGLKKLFPEYCWKTNFNSISSGVTNLKIYCNNKNVFDYSISSYKYRENLMTFTENFIILEKLEIATR